MVKAAKPIIDLISVLRKIPIEYCGAVQCKGRHQNSKPLAAANMLQHATAMVDCSWLLNIEDEASEF